MTRINRGLLENSIAIDGEGTKQIIAMEEMAELTQQISKVLRNKPDREHLIEEYADVRICLEMLRIIHDIKDEEVQKWIDYKMERQDERDKRKNEGMKECCGNCKHNKRDFAKPQNKGYSG